MTNMRVVIEMDDLHCPTCGTGIERSLGKVHGVEHARLSFGTGRMEVEYDPGEIDPDQIRSKVKDLGYGILEAEMEG